MKTVTLNDKTFEVEKGQPILDAALFAGLDFPFDCRVGSCGHCKCTLTDGQIRQLDTFEYALLPEEIDNNVILACQSTVKTDVVISLDDANE
ncbi:2Fe-2S iron-sulfur cluster binding domain-containing protein [Aliiglaciecola sp. M165]|uniref:2Fe-2S iron-sulfur cluster-binding protein n=1 Tax=Aliiglaciecola sp. M165 TaxID=2593649 RepID=UPI00117EB131|nr:2Fe-2S iron-sulfur cluster binding domain-containing protein [Aliiglaciecola sp. M165]TRY32572.1 2Fe-2S iron-sulfur cluster binding domain-containing protein [Aliiglaciecola sp. M165]